ncbi:NAD(P)H-hydrate dehydratase, partial [Candidatus Woesearchaeota archaeon]|nr:NAD(P)H-hydrate dehydratase [Candidatus Woesearchaeota archaeon]
GDNGKVLVVGGSKDYVGAVALAGLAALRSGADLVNIAAPEKVAWAVNCISPDLIATKVKGDYFRKENAKIIVDLKEKFDVLLIGNGIGLKNETKKFCKKAIRGIGKLKVIDADAIKSINSNDAENSIITPHLKELEQFLKNSNVGKTIINNIINQKNIVKKSLLIKKALKKFFDKDNIVLLKGKIDAIISSDGIYYNKTGNAGMTKGGTGDVLAGLCAGFLAQNGNLMQSAVNAAYFNGMIGDILLKKKKGFAYLASDMAGEIKNVLKLQNKMSLR